jgi:hypothetical protein
MLIHSQNPIITSNTEKKQFQFQEAPVTIINFFIKLTVANKRKTIADPPTGRNGTPF